MKPVHATTQNVALELRKAADSLGYSALKLARAIGASPGAVWGVLHAKYNPSREMVMRLAKVLDVSISGRALEDFTSVGENVIGRRVRHRGGKALQGPIKRNRVPRYPGFKAPAPEKVHQTQTSTYAGELALCGLSNGEIVQLHGRIQQEIARRVMEANGLRQLIGELPFPVPDSASKEEIEEINKEKTIGNITIIPANRPE
jgi:transcriptional regulator with XRE-family HTH domain